MTRDLRFCLRTLLQNPGFAFVTVLTIALGIGVNTAILSVVKAVLLDPLPYRQAGRLVRINEHVRGNQFNCSYPNYLDWRQRNRSFEEMAIYNPAMEMILEGDQPEAVPAALTESHLFAMLGHPPALGRTFTAPEENGKDAGVVVLTDKLWRRRFSADPQVIGRQARFGGFSYTVVGVLPPQFELGPTEVFLPLKPALNANMLDRGNHPGFAVIARLKPDATAESAGQEMRAIGAALEREYPVDNKDTWPVVTPLLDFSVGRVRQVLLILLGAVALVLLIACANVASVLLARAVSRQREIAVRMALGAGRMRVVRLLLAESLTLSLIGGAGGVLLAWWTMDLLRAIQPAVLPRAGGIGLDWKVLAYSAGLSVFTGLLFGLIPAIQASRPDLNGSLKRGDRTSAGGLKQRARWALVAAEVAMALVLLAGAGLLVRSLWSLDGVDLGYRAASVSVGELKLYGPKWNNDAIRQFTGRLVDEAKSLPGVESAAVAWPPLGRVLTWSPSVTVDPQDGKPGREGIVQATSVSPEFFRTLGITVLRGRVFSPGDQPATPHVAVVNQEFARIFFAGENAVGRKLKMQGVAGPNQWAEIVGVVSSARRFGPAVKPAAEVYWAFAQNPIYGPALLLRGGPDGSEAALRNLLKPHPGVVLHRWDRFDNLMSATTDRWKFTRTLLASFALLALTLAAIGVYGVISYSVAQRSREIGIRMALGARRREIVALVARQSLSAVLSGIAAGIPLSLLLTRFLKSQLFGVQPYDPLTHALVAALLVAIALAACAIPARRAASIDPASALRAD